MNTNEPREMAGRGMASECATRQSEWVTSPLTESAETRAQMLASHQPRIAALARRLLGWQDELDDVVQEVFVTALQALPRFRGDCELGTWLYRITVHQCRRYQRRRVWQRRLRLGFLDHAARPAVPTSDAASLSHERHAAVREAVARLPMRDREVVVLRHLEGLAIAEIAQIVGCRQNAVEVRLSRARARLSEVLRDTQTEARP